MLLARRRPPHKSRAAPIRPGAGSGSRRPAPAAIGSVPSTGPTVVGPVRSRDATAAGRPALVDRPGGPPIQRCSESEVAAEEYPRRGSRARPPARGRPAASGDGALRPLLGREHRARARAGIRRDEQEDDICWRSGGRLKSNAPAGSPQAPGPRPESTGRCCAACSRLPWPPSSGGSLQDRPGVSTDARITCGAIVPGPGPPTGLTCRLPHGGIGPALPPAGRFGGSRGGIR